MSLAQVIFTSSSLLKVPPYFVAVLAGWEPLWRAASSAATAAGATAAPFGSFALVLMHALNGAFRPSARQAAKYDELLAGPHDGWRPVTLPVASLLLVRPNETVLGVELGADATYSNLAPISDPRPSAWWLETGREYGRWSPVRVAPHPRHLHER